MNKILIVACAFTVTGCWIEEPFDWAYFTHFKNTCGYPVNFVVSSILSPELELVVVNPGEKKVLVGVRCNYFSRDIFFNSVYDLASDCTKAWGEKFHFQINANGRTGILNAAQFLNVLKKTPYIKKGSNTYEWTISDKSFCLSDDSAASKEVNSKEEVLQ